MDSPRISLIFVNYRSAFELASALKSLFSLEQNQGLFEVIVINNDPSEERVLAELSRKLSLRLFSLPHNSGFGQAANIGAAQAKGSILGFINPDTVWQQSLLPQVASFFRTTKGESILGVGLVSGDGQSEHWSRGRFPHLGSLMWQNIWPFSGKTGEGAPDWVSGGALFVTKEVFSSLSGFDERFFLYFEDVDFCLRAKHLGIGVTIDLSCPLLHRGGRSFSSTREQKERFYVSQQQYYDKHRPGWEAFSIRVLHLILHNW